jgi:hypothetical protein
LPLPASRITWTALIFFLLCSVNARATDIQCESTKQPAQRVICDHAILNHEYSDIYDQQQALVQQGKLSPGDIAAWKQKRDACTDVHCIDGVFAQWGAADRNLANSPAAPVMNASEALGPAGGAGASEAIAPAAAMTASDALGPTPGGAQDIAAASAASAAAAASAQASGVPVSRQGSAYGVALPQAVSETSAAPASAVLANAPASDSVTSNPLLVVLVVLLVIAALGVGGIIMYQRRRS